MVASFVDEIGPLELQEKGGVDNLQQIEILKAPNLRCFFLLIRAIQYHFMVNGIVYCRSSPKGENL